MTIELLTQNKDLIEKLSSLKESKSTRDLLQGLKKQERIDKMLVILLDVSDSMGERFDVHGNLYINIPSNSSPNKLEMAWKVFQEQLVPNMNGWTYGIIMFGSDAWWDILPTSDTTVLAVHQAPTPNGMTSMGKALQITWAWVKSNVKQARFVMLTDGQPNDMDKGQILGMTAANSTIPIDTVGIGSGTFDYDPIFLRQLSLITGGIFCEVNTVKLLSDTIKRLSPIERPLLGTVNKE